MIKIGTCEIKTLNDVKGYDKKNGNCGKEMLDDDISPTLAGKLKKHLNDRN